jgi:putative addiction module CopG family antidote
MMKLSLDASTELLIAERLKSGRYASAEDVVTAALHALEQDETGFDFQPGELDRLIAEGEASETLDGHAVLDEIRQLGKSRQ